MGRHLDDHEHNKKTLFRESDSFDEAKPQNKSKQIGRFSGFNRFGESDIRHDSFQDDQFFNDYDPTYEDEYGMKHPYVHSSGEKNDWSHDIRSTASKENHYGKGPKNYRRSDEKIKDDIFEILKRCSDIDASSLEVNVIDGRINLKGTVCTQNEKRLAEDLVDDIIGVVDVRSQIEVKFSSRSDNYE